MSDVNLKKLKIQIYLSSVNTKKFILYLWLIYFYLLKIFKILIKFL